MFACCSSWVSCSYLGYCTHRTPTKESTYDGDVKVFDCSLGYNLFINPKEDFKESFYASASKIAESHGYVEKCYPEDKVKFDAMLSNYRKKFSARSIRSSSGGWQHYVAGIRIKGDDVWMPKQTIIEKKDGLELVSWMYKDVVHYGIQEAGGGMLEIFAPTPQLRGNALRAQVMQLFKERQKTEYIGKWPTVAMDVASIQEGQVIAYESRPGTVTFALIRKKTPSLIFAISNTGSDSVWLTERMDQKIQKREVQIIARESVPGKFNTFPEEAHL